MFNEWQEELLRCVEGLYVVEEESKKIVWANSYIIDKVGDKCIGDYCWKAFLARETPCAFCPKLTPEDDVYVWDYFTAHGKRWMKVKHLVFEKNGILYRAANVNMIDDVMRLNYDTVQEILMLKSVLSSNQNKMDTLSIEAISDNLTGLFNRNCFQLDLENTYCNAEKLGVLYFDLNNLKQINDKFRHTAGDALLRRMGIVLRRIHRHIKTAKCYRVGGDEFVVLLKGCTEEELAHCEGLFNSYMQGCNKGETHQCVVAIGKAYSKEACDPEMLVSKADHDMYRCKQIMKNKTQ